MSKFTQSLNRMKELALRVAASGLFPAKWLYKTPKSTQLSKPAEQPKHIEIVSHCWNYSHLFAYQLQSLVNHAPNNMTITLTGFYSIEDQDSVALVEHFKQRQVPNVTWNFIPLSTPDLLRRAIGRNQAAKKTKADWIWFADCDLLFGEDTFESLQEQLTGEQSILVFPDTLYRTVLLPKDDQLLGAKTGDVDMSVLDTTDFHPYSYEKAAGAIQIIYGDIARDIGYCDDISCYQQPKERWVKTYEDRAIRWVLGTHGKPLPIRSVSIIRHVEKGRYMQDSALSEIRKKNRQIKDKMQS